MAKKYKVNYCITNELKVRKAIKSEGFKVVGTLGIILRAYNLGKLNKENCINILKKIKSNSKEYRFHSKLINISLNKINNSN